MAHRDPRDHRRKLRLPVIGQRTRVVAALLGCLISVATPMVLLGKPALTVDGRPTVRAPDDPAGLGITGALPGDPLPGDALLGDALIDGLLGDPADTEPPADVGPKYSLDGSLGIPGVVLDAYQRAARTLATTQPGCHLSWAVLAGIGRIESGHASDGRVDAAGNTLGPILGPQLNGSPGIAAIMDTDDGALDQDPVWDRAIGPMQFIPSSWRRYGVDGNGDGVASPHNIYDSTLAAGSYLCAGGADLFDPAQLLAAVFRYNHSESYVTIVLRWTTAYLTGVVPTPPAPGPVPPDSNGNGGLPVVIDSSPLSAEPPLVLAPPAAPPPLPPRRRWPSPPPATPTESDNTPPPATPSTTPSPSPEPTPTPPATPSPSPEPTPTPPADPPTDLPPPAPTSSPSPSPPVITPTPSPAPPTQSLTAPT